jgi:hypothetical protein
MFYERFNAEVEAQSRMIKGLAEFNGIGTDHCEFAKDIIPIDGEGTKTCTCTIDPYPDIPVGCGCFRFGLSCWAAKK